MENHQFNSVFWFLCYSLLLIVDSAVLCSVVLTKDWDWINLLDSANGRIIFSFLLLMLSISMMKCVSFSKDSFHISTSILFTYIGALIFAVWGVLEHMGSLKHIDMVTTDLGKWIFTAICTFIFLPWLWCFQGQIRSQANTLRIHIFKQEHGSLYGFLYAWSGAAYILMKVYVLIGLGALLLLQSQWDSYLNGEGFVANYLSMLKDKE